MAAHLRAAVPELSQPQVSCSRKYRPHSFKEISLDNSKPVDQPDQATVDVRQGTGPRETVSVLLISLVLASLAGIAFIAYFKILS